MIIQDITNPSVKTYIPFNSKTDLHILTDKFRKDLGKLDTTLHDETAKRINGWVSGSDRTPIFEFKNRFDTGKPPRHILAYGVQIRHRHPPTHAVVFVEKITPDNPKLPVSHKFFWHRIFTDYDDYINAVEPAGARNMFLNSGL